MGVLEQFVNGQRFAGVLPHAGLEPCPLIAIRSRQAEILASPYLVFVRRLVSLSEMSIKRALAANARLDPTSQTCLGSTTPLTLVEAAVLLDVTGIA